MTTRLGALSVPAVAVLSLVVPLGLAGPAHAETYSHTDATHDVVRLGDSGSSQVKVPKQSGGDITRITTRFGRRTLTLTARMRALPAPTYVAAWLVKTDSGKRYVVEYIRNKKGGRVRFGTLAKPSKCAAITHDVDFGSATLVLTVPRRCLGGTDTVRTAFVTESIHTGDDFVLLLDDAQRDRGFDDDMPAVGPVVRRG